MDSNNIKILNEPFDTFIKDRIEYNLLTDTKDIGDNAIFNDLYTGLKSYINFDNFDKKYEIEAFEISLFNMTLRILKIIKELKYTKAIDVLKNDFQYTLNISQLGDSNNEFGINLNIKKDKFNYDILLFNVKFTLSKINLSKVYNTNLHKEENKLDPIPLEDYILSVNGFATDVIFENNSKLSIYNWREILSKTDEYIDLERNLVSLFNKNKGIYLNYSNIVIIPLNTSKKGSLLYEHKEYLNKIESKNNSCEDFILTLNDIIISFYNRNKENILDIINFCNLNLLNHNIISLYKPLDNIEYTIKKGHFKEEYYMLGTFALINGYVLA